MSIRTRIRELEALQRKAHKTGDQYKVLELQEQIDALEADEADGEEGAEQLVGERWDGQS